MTVIAKADPCLFTAFALLNATGYNTENGWQFNRVRKAVRLRLARRAEYWHSTLSSAGLLEPLQRAGGAMLMDIVPFLSPPPAFVFQTDAMEYTTHWQRESRLSLAGIDQWLRRIYEEEQLDLLWLEHLRAYEEVVSMLQQLGSSLEAIATRFNESSMASALEIVLLPNLLDANGRGYSLSTSQSTWLFLGVMDDSSQAEELAVHELLHRWVDIAAEQIVQNSEGPDPMPEAKAQYRIVADSYPDLAIWVGETVVRAATIWLKPKLRNSTLQSEQELLAYSEQIGFVGIQDAYHHLKNSQTPLIDSIQEAVKLVYDCVLMESSARG